MTGSTSHERVLWGMLGLVVAGALAMIVRHPDVGELLADGYVYLLMADALRLGDAANPTVAFLFRHYPFPPLFPMLLGILGAGADTFERVLVINSALLGLSCTLAGLWFRSLGITRGPALALALVLALLPVTFVTAIDVQSEPLYLVLTLGSLVLLGSSRRRARWRLAALCAGLAVLARTAGLALLVAFTLVWLTRGRRQGLLPIVLVWLPYLAWQATKQAFALSASYLNFAPFPPGEVLPSALRQIVINLQALAESALRCIDFASTPHVAVMVAVLATFAANGFLRRLRSGEYDGLYVAAYLALILIWPYPHHMQRFLFVLLPLLAGYAMLTLASLTGRLRVGWSGRLSYLLPAVTLMMALPSLGQIAHELGGTSPPVARALARTPARYVSNSPADVARQRAAFAPVVGILARARTELPANACISSAVPELTMFHARRPSRTLAETGNAPRLLLKECPYVLMVAFRAFPDNGLPPLFPYHELRSELQILDVAQSDPHQGRQVVRALLAVHRGRSKL